MAVKNEIDLRSDTATRPSPGMRRAMAEAEVGDDMFGEDPTVNRLEAMICEMLGKEAAVYASSGTQSNQMGVRIHCQLGDELLIESTGHIANYEQGAPAALSGVSCRLIEGDGGILDVGDLAGKIRPDNQHFPRTALVCLENTTNLGGGRVYPQENIDRICEWAHANGLPVHLDGARLFNAVTASGVPVDRMVRDIDTISICFSKGLGCPMGSILVGSKAEIARARRVRKLFGGALRQAGITAAAAIYALENNLDRLKDDHAHAQQFTAGILKIPGITLAVPEVQSNLVFFYLAPELGTAAALSARLKERGVRINASGPQRLRACTHLDVTGEQVETAVKIIGEVLSEGLGTADPAHASSPYARA